MDYYEKQSIVFKNVYAINFKQLINAANACNRKEFIS